MNQERKLKEKDVVNREEFILKHIKLVGYIARSYYNMHSNHDGIIAAGLLCLCEIAQSILDRDIHESLYPNYVVLKVKDAMRRFIASDQTISMSHNTFFKMMTNGNLPHSDWIEYHPLSIVDKVCKFHHLIEDLKLCPRDRMVLDMRMEGHKDAHIATCLGCTSARVSQLRASIGRTLLNLLEDDEHDYESYKTR